MAGPDDLGATGGPQHAAAAARHGAPDALLAPKASESWVLAQLAAYYTDAQTDAAIAAALAGYYNQAAVDAAIASTQTHYSTTAQMNAAIAAAVAGVDLSGYHTSAQTDAAIAAALVPVTLSNAPAWSGNTTWELLKGSNVIRNLNFAGPLVASLQNNTDTLQILCDAHSTNDTYTRLQTASLIADAINNLPDYATQAEVDSSINTALAPYYTAAQVDAEIAANGADLSDYYNMTESDSRYFVKRAGGGNTSLVRAPSPLPPSGTCCPGRR